jgi:hypothetical protein
MKDNKEHQSASVEEAAKEYGKRYGRTYEYCANAGGVNHTEGELVEAFESGANWMKEQQEPTSSKPVAYRIIPKNNHYNGEGIFVSNIKPEERGEYEKQFHITPLFASPGEPTIPISAYQDKGLALSARPQKDGTKTEYKCGFTCIGTWATRLDKHKVFINSTMGKYIMKLEESTIPVREHKTLKELLSRFNTEQENVSETLFNVYPEEMAFISRTLGRRNKRIEELEQENSIPVREPKKGEYWIYAHNHAATCPVVLITSIQGEYFNIQFSPQGSGATKKRSYFIRPASQYEVACFVRTQKEREVEPRGDYYRGYEDALKWEREN